MRVFPSSWENEGGNGMIGSEWIGLDWIALHWMVLSGYRIIGAWMTSIAGIILIVFTYLVQTYIF